ncbi:MAG: hypothetical protein ACK47B_22140 [Armatimonadota bacterium]
MADGIRINDAAIEISSEGVEALTRREGADLRVTRLDLSISPEALNTLLAGFAPAGEPAPSAEVGDGRLQVTGSKDGKRMSLDLQLGAVRIELTPEGIRLVGGGA